MKNNLRTVFFTIADTKLQNNTNARNLDFDGFVKSFKRFHPEHELVVFDETHLKLQGLNYYNAKASFGRMLSENYDLVVNVDADHYFFDRAHEILAGDYDIACPANFNITDNLVGINVKSGINGASNEQVLISVTDFLQGGLIASPNKQFWKHYEYAVNKYYNKFVCFENDVLNLVAYLYPYEVKVLEGATHFREKGRTCWYGCSIIGREKDCYIQNNLIMLDGLPVKAYHFAHGGGKKKYNEVFNNEVSEFIKQNIIN